MAEIEPASDELVAATEAEANEVDAFWGDLAGVEIAAGPLRAILARLRKSERERDEAREIAIAGFGIHAARYAADFGLPDGHLFAQHYDTLAKLGARMDSFTRAANGGNND